MKNPTQKLTFLIILAVIAVTLACSLPSIQISLGTPDVPNVETSSPTSEPPSNPTAELVITEEPTESSHADMPPASFNMETYDSGVIRFFYDRSVFMDVDAQTIPAVQNDPNGMPFNVAPLHTELTLKGYIIGNHFHTPKMYIYPALEFSSMLDSVRERIDTLKLIIANQSSDVQGNIPFLPLENAGQVFHSNFKQLQFQNGAGVRYVTMYSQGIYAINNHDVFYTFQGITSDGKTYISLVLPVNNILLPANGDIPPAGETMESFSNKYQTYLANSVAQLNTSPDDSFTPDLQLLDELVQSITLK
jgi:hypothetical protein